MKITVRELVGWKEALNAARTTVWKSALEKGPSDSFIRESLISEHSHIRELLYAIEIEGIKSWVATHLVRHHVGVEKYVATQRDDRNPQIMDRDQTPQGNLVNMRITLNAQAILNISHRRLCHAAHKETRIVWILILKELRKIAPELAEHCVPSCVYRGFCPERKETRAACPLNWIPWRMKYLEMIPGER